MSNATGIHLLASYPKSGNTWVRALLHAFRRNTGEIDINDDFESPVIMDRSLFDTTLDIDSADLTAAEIFRMRPALHRMLMQETTELKWYKSHDANLPAPGATEPPFAADMLAGVVLIVRDPRDVAPSLADHRGETIDRTIASMANRASIIANKRNMGQVPHLVSSWSEFYRSWLETPAIRLLLLRYENLLTDTETQFAKLLVFAGIDADPERIRRAIEATRFETMAGQEARDGFHEIARNAKTRFFRVGRAGTWRQTLTPEQAGRIEHDHGSMMRLLGYLV